MAFLDGNQTLRLCEPMKQYIEARGGQVLLNKPLASTLHTKTEDFFCQGGYSRVRFTVGSFGTPGSTGLCPGIETNEDGSVKHFLMRDGEKVVADEYISSVS